MVKIAEYRCKHGSVYSLHRVNENEFLVNFLCANNDEVYDLHRILRVGDTSTFTDIDVSDANQTDVQSLRLRMFLGAFKSQFTYNCEFYPKGVTEMKITKHFTSQTDCAIEAAHYLIADKWDHQIKDLEVVKM